MGQLDAIEQNRSLGGRPRPTEHIVHFYEDEDYFLGELISYVTDGVTAGEAIVLIATPAHLAEIERRLPARGMDVAASRKAGTYITADAAETLELFMSASGPDPERFEAVIEELVTPALGADGRRRVRAFGEMVALLCDRDQYTAALDLERLWSVTARRLSFSLLCAYPVGLFKEERPGGSLSQTAASHDTVIRSGRRAPLIADIKPPLD